MTTAIDEKIARYTEHAKILEEQQKIKDKLTQKIILKHAEASTEKRLDALDKRFSNMLARQ